MTDDLIERLGRTLTTMSNDDTSAQGTDLRRRHVERVLAVQDARDRIESDAARIRELEAQGVVVKPLDDPEQGDSAQLVIPAQFVACAHGSGWWVAEDADGNKVLFGRETPALTPAPVPDRGKMVRPAKGQAMCGGYPTGEAPAPVMVQEAARERVARAIYEAECQSDPHPECCANWSDFPDHHWKWHRKADAALSALAGQGGE